MEHTGRTIPESTVERSKYQKQYSPQKLCSTYIGFLETMQFSVTYTNDWMTHLSPADVSEVEGEH